MNNRIVLICSGQITLNPRLVKEADALYQSGYDVTVIYLYWNSWGKGLDEKLLKQKRWRAICAGGDPDTNPIIYGITRIVHKIAKIMARTIGLKYNLAEMAIGRAVWLLTKETCRHPADLYIAHNLAALSVAIKGATKNHSKCALDAEDFYRNGLSDDPENFDVKLKTFLEEKYYPYLNYLTASSEGIVRRYKELFPSKIIELILNVFPENKDQIMDYKKNHKGLKLFWFSQSVGMSRGIQDVIGAMKILEDKYIEFHILGDINIHVQSELNEFTKNLNFKKVPEIIYHKPIEPDRLIKFAGQFDIGLATEPGFSINNDIALSNKLFTYINAGLAIIASDTTAQIRFLKKHPDIGKSYRRKDPISLSIILREYFENKELLAGTRQASYLLGKTELNWENESKKFIHLINSTLNISANY